MGRSWFVPALIGGVVFLLYAGALRFGFVYDDGFQVVDNPWLTAARYIPRFFTRHVWAFAGISGMYWRPLFLLWLFVQRSIFGVNPVAWHATTVLMHAIATALVFVLARRLSSDRTTAAIAALIFGVHPALIESVTWVSGVSDPLLAVVFIPSFLFFLSWQERRSRAALAGSLVFYALALMAKEPALVLVALVAAYAWFVGGPQAIGPRSALQKLRAAIYATLPYLPVTIAYLGVRWLIITSRIVYMSSAPTLLQQLLTAPSLLWFYLRLLVWPGPISPEYDLDLITGFSVLHVLAPVLAIAAAVVAIKYWSRHLERDGDTRAGLVSFSAVWIVIPILPVLYLKGLTNHDFAHARYLYLPCIGFGLLIALAVRMLPGSGVRIAGVPARHFAAALVVVFALAAANLVQQVYWTNDLVLFSRGMSIAPKNPTAVDNLAIEYGKRGQYDRAIALLNSALQNDPYDWHANFSLGYTYFVLGRYAEAEPLIEKAVRLRPIDADPDQYAYLGLTANRLGNLPKAEWAVRHAIQRAPEVVRYHYALALILEAEGKLAQASEEFRAVLRLDPSNAAVRQRLSRISGN